MIKGETSNIIHVLPRRKEEEIGAKRKRSEELDTSKDSFSGSEEDEINSEGGGGVKEVGFNFQRILTPKK